MTVIAIHADRRPLARVTIDLSKSRVDSADKDFPMVAQFFGECDHLPGVPVTDRTVLGAFLDGPARTDILAGTVKSVTLSCGSTETIVLTLQDQPDQTRPGIFFEHDGEMLPFDRTPIGTVLTETQRHFLSRAPQRARA